MERYTEKHYTGNGHYLLCSGTCETLNCGDCGILDKIVDRLASYEDTGLTPEEVQQMRWISVEERLPEKEGIYIVCVDGEVKSDAYCMLEGIERWLCYDGSINALYIDPYSSKPLRDGPYPRVTHWMFLPQPPKEEKKND